MRLLKLWKWEVVSTGEWVFPGTGGCCGTLPCSNPDYRETSFSLYKNTSLKTFSCRYGCPNAKECYVQPHSQPHWILHFKILELEHISNMCRIMFNRQRCPHSGPHECVNEYRGFLHLDNWKVVLKLFMVEPHRGTMPLIYKNTSCIRMCTSEIGAMTPWLRVHLLLPRT